MTSEQAKFDLIDIWGDLHTFSLSQLIIMYHILFFFSYYWINIDSELLHMIYVAELLAVVLCFCQI